jgi:hypothetical protein
MGSRNSSHHTWWQQWKKQKQWAAIRPCVEVTWRHVCDYAAGGISAADVSLLDGASYDVGEMGQSTSGTRVAAVDRWTLWPRALPRLAPSSGAVRRYSSPRLALVGGTEPNGRDELETHLPAAST